MFRIKLWLIIFSLLLISLDKFSFVSRVRDCVTIYMQKQTSLLIYRLDSYPRLVLLQFSQQRQLEQENVNLKRQVQQYAIRLKQQTNQAGDAEAIASLNLQSTLYKNFNTILASAVVDINYLVNDKLLIDKGKDSGLASGMAVANKDGIIGQISIVDSNNSQVNLITNPNVKIYLQAMPSKSKMLAQGIGNNELIVKYISKSDKVKVGDVLVTTGLDNLYPANIPVARVTKVFYENNGFNSAICAPVVDFDKLQYVLVFKNATQ